MQTRPVPPQKSLVVGLTGSIGSGKTEAARIFESLGAVIIDADLLSREAVDKGTEALEEIGKKFGRDMIRPDGSLDRKALGALVFKDPLKRRELEDIVHPRVRRLFLDKLKRATNTGAKLVVYVVPLLFESRFSYDELRYIVVMNAPKEEILKRVMKRDGCSRDEAELKFASQLPPAEKVKRADFTIENTGSLEELEVRVRALYTHFKAISG
jgi:dephospho-CoA kinase